MGARSPQEVAQQLAKALSSGDSAGVLSAYENAAVFIPPGAPASDPREPSRTKCSTPWRGTDPIDGP